MTSLKHCTSEKLLAYLDDELAPAEWQELKGHLSACWRCRARAQELENGILKLAREFSGPHDFPDEWQIADAKNRFLKWRDSQDRSSMASFTLLPWRLSPAIASAVAVVCMALAGVGIWARLEPGPPGVLARAEEAEKVLFPEAATIHEVFRLEIKQTVSSTQTSTGHLEIWSEPSGKRFAWRWKDDAFRLKFAEWHPGAEENYVFDERTSRAVPRKAVSAASSNSLADIAEPGSSIEQVNIAFVNWVQSQHWRLISITRDFLLFSTQDGIPVSMRRVRSTSGASRFLLQAERSEGGRQLALILEVDEATGRPVSETARITSEQGLVELRVVIDQIQSMRTIPASLHVFRPEVAAFRNTMPERTSTPRRVFRPRPSLAIDPRLLEEAEVQVLYGLHRAGLCLGAPISVAQDRSLGKVLVTGLVDGEEEKERAVTAISELPTATLVRIDVKTLAEAAERVQPVRARSITGVAGVSETPAPVVPIETLIERSSLPDSEKAQLKRKASEISNRLISATEILVRETWALHRLRERFSPINIELLGDESRKLVALMAGDHLMMLDRTGSEVEEMIDPFRLVANAPDAMVRDSAASYVANGSDSRLGFEDLLQSAELINRQSQSLFALGGSAQSSAAGDFAQKLFLGVPRFKVLLQEAHQTSADMYERKPAHSAPKAELEGPGRSQ